MFRKTFLFCANLFWRQGRDIRSLVINVCRFVQGNGARCVTVSVPYMTTFLFSLKVSWKFDVYVLQRNWKGKFIIGSAISFIISYTSVINTCKMLWWIVISFWSFSICWRSCTTTCAENMPGGSLTVKRGVENYRKSQTSKIFK